MPSTCASLCVVVWTMLLLDDTSSEEEVRVCPTAHGRGKEYLVAVRGLDEEDIGGKVGQLDAIWRHRLTDGIWAYERRCDEVKAGIQVLLCRQIMLRSSEANLQYSAQEEELLACLPARKLLNR